MNTTSTQNRRLKSTLSVTAAAAGLTTALAGQADAAALNTDLVQNGGFETNPDTSWTRGTFSAPGAVGVGVYNYSQDFDNRADDVNFEGGSIVPPGNDPTSATDYYWSMNDGDISAFQAIDLSAGDTAATIAAGLGQYDISAYFTTYQTNEEFGRLTLEFLDNSSTVIGSAITFDDPNNDEWSLVGGTGAIPVGTVTAVITLDRSPLSGLTAGPDIYVDNVAFSVSEIPEPSSLALLGLAGLLMAQRRRG